MCGAAADELALEQTTAELTMQCLTNYAGAQSGLPSLQLDPTLNRAGNAKLAANLSCDEFSHTPCGQPFDAVFAEYTRGAAGYEIGENIAWGTGSYGTPREAMNGWLHSPGHRENLLNADYRELGIGYLPARVFQGYGGATLWAQEFGTAERGAATVVVVAASTDTKAQTLAPKKPARRAKRLSRFAAAP